MSHFSWLTLFWVVPHNATGYHRRTRTAIQSWRSPIPRLGTTFLRWLNNNSKRQKLGRSCFERNAKNSSFFDIQKMEMRPDCVVSIDLMDKREKKRERETPLVVTTLKSTLLVFQPKQTSCDPNKTLEYSQGPSFESGQIWSDAQPQWSSKSQGERKTKTTPRSQSVSFQKVHLYLAQPNPTPPPPPTLPQS